MSQKYDVIIVGAGPAGLSAAIYSGRALLDTMVLEKGMSGGQILLSDWIENYPGFSEGIAPFSLMESFRHQTERFGAKIVTEEAKEIQKIENLWYVQGGEKGYLARAVIVATGSAHRKLGVPGESELTGRGVSFCATCDGAFFRDKVVGVVGGGSWALTEALFLTKFCKLVKIIHRRQGFRAEKILVARARENEKVEFMLDTVVERISGKNKLESVILKNVETQKTIDAPFDGLFISIGMDPNTKFLGELLDLNEWGEIVVKKKMATSQPGIYAAGDVTDACSKQVATAVGSGVEAAISVDDYLQNQ
jgi:thioredoxin reductase (NADPH)